MYVDCISALQLKLRVAPLTRAVAEARVISKKPVFSDSSEEEGEIRLCASSALGQCFKRSTGVRHLMLGITGGKQLCNC